jgi:hypothetical protein
MPDTKNDLGKAIIRELNQDPPQAHTHTRNLWSTISIPVLAIITGLILGGVLIAFTTPSVYEAFSVSFGKGLSTALMEIGKAYQALFEGAIGNPARILESLRGGDAREIRMAVNPLKALFSLPLTSLLVWLLLLVLGLVSSILA